MSIVLELASLWWHGGTAVANQTSTAAQAIAATQDEVFKVDGEDVGDVRAASLQCTALTGVQWLGGE